MIIIMIITFNIIYYNKNNYYWKMFLFLERRMSEDSAHNVHDNQWIF